MKRALFIALTFLSAAMGCQREKSPETAEGEPVDVSFRVYVPGETKAIGDGGEALRLTIRVYDANHNFLQAFTADRAANESGWTLKASVVPGIEYDFCFWACSPESKAYGFDGQYVTVDYSKITPNSNQDEAFWGTQSVKVTGAFTQDVTLRRPLGLLALYMKDDCPELGQADLNDAGKFVSALTLKGSIPARLNLQSGEVDQPQAQVAFADAPLTSLETDQTYGTALAYAYVLVPSGGLTLSEVEYSATLKKTSPETDLASGIANNVPLARNQRTLLVTEGGVLELGSITIADWTSQGSAINGEAQDN